MAISKKAKFFASSLTAAVAVSAVAPTVFASELPADVADHEEADKVQLLMEAGVVEGFPDGTFQPGTSVTRAAAAKMLSVLLELDTENAPATDLTDVKEDAWYTGYVNALVAEGIINGYEDDTFRPNEELNRAEFAKMVVEAYGLEIAADADHPFTDVEDKWYKDYVVTLYANGLINGTTDTTFSPDAQLKRIDFAKLAVDTDVEHGTLLNSYLELNISDVETPEYNKIEVHFNQEVAEFDRNDVTLADEDNNRVFASDVDIAEDGKSAYVSFYQGLTDEATYDLSIVSGEDTLDFTFDYVEGDVAEIVAEDVRIDETKEYTVEYTVLSESGVDVTGKYDATFNDTQNVVDEDTGVINAGTLTQVTFVEITVGDVTSDRFRVIPEASNAASFEAFTVAEQGATIDWDDADDIRDYVKLGEDTKYLHVNLLDQFGEAATGDATFESLTPGVLIVDKTTGELTPRAEGAADIRVTAGDVSTIITVNVLAEAKPASIEFKDVENNTITLSDKLVNADLPTVTIELKDQYGDVITDADAYDISVKGESVDVTNVGDNKDVDTFDVYDINETGTTTVTVEQGDLTAALDIVVVEAGETVGYELTGVQDLDLHVDGDKVNDTTVKLYPVDENGLETGGAVSADFKVEEVDGDYTKEYTGTSASIVASELDGVKSYTLTASLDDLVVAESTFDVVNTESDVVFTQKEGNVEVSYLQAEQLNEVLTGAFEAKKDGVSQAISSFEFYSNDTTIITDSADGGEVLDLGEATLYITHINGVELDNDYQVNVDVTTDITIDGVVANFEEATVSDYEFSYNGTDYNPVVTDDTYSLELNSATGVVYFRSVSDSTYVIKSVYSNEAYGSFSIVK